MLVVVRASMITLAHHHERASNCNQDVLQKIEMQFEKKNRFVNP